MNKSAFKHHYRSNLSTIKPSSTTTSAKLNNVVQSINNNKPEHAKEVLRVTVNCLTGKDNTNSPLAKDVIDDIQYLTGNSNNGFLGIGVKDTPKGATKILFASAAKIKPDLLTAHNPTSKEKAQFVSDVLTHMINHPEFPSSKEFPNLPRNKQGTVKFSDNSYFDDCQLNNGQIIIKGCDIPRNNANEPVSTLFSPAQSQLKANSKIVK